MSEVLVKNKSSLFEKLVPALLIITIGLAFLVGVLWQKVENLGKGGTTATTDTTQQAPQPKKIAISQIKDLFNKDLVKFGDENSKVIFVEVSDPSCPYCHVAGGLNPSLNSQIGPQFKLVKDGGTYIAPVPEMKKLVDSGKASFIWIYYPGHGNGEMGAKALYCANEKGKFWKVSDLLMTSAGYDLMNNVVKNDKAQAGKLADFLKSAINFTDMKSCLESGKYDTRLANDMVIAKDLGITGTPGFYVNDTNFAGAYSYKDMESVVASALK
jgi:protein-disulfide isomerase